MIYQNSYDSIFTIIFNNNLIKLNNNNNKMISIKLLNFSNIEEAI